MAEQTAELDGAAHTMTRSLTAIDLVFLAIGAVIGAGIFSAIGTAAAGEVNASGVVQRYGAGPALVISFLVLGVVCGLAALCYAELASMIPTAGSAYAYSYATLGELVAWIIGWDLILEYAVGNVAVAISWSGYFASFLTGFGVELPGWITHGYYDVVLSADPKIHGLIDTCPRILGMPVLVNLPAFTIVAAVTGLLLFGVRESARVNNVMVVVKLLVLTLFIIVGLNHLDMDNYKPFAPNGWRGIHQGAAVVFFAYIGFDAISTAAEETKDPQRNMPRGILWGLGICTLFYVIVGAVITGLVPWEKLRGVSDPLAFALQYSGIAGSGAGGKLASWIVVIGALISTTAVLLVFQYGQPRILFAMARDGLLPQRAARLHPKYRTPWLLTLLTGIFVALGSLVGDDESTYDLTNIGTLFAFALVSIGVMVLRKTDPDRPRPFRVPAVWLLAPLSTAACIWTMAGLPPVAWKRFAVWLAIGLAFYFVYGFSRSRLNNANDAAAEKKT